MYVEYGAQNAERRIFTLLWDLWLFGPMFCLLVCNDVLQLVSSLSCAVILIEYIVHVLYRKSNEILVCRASDEGHMCCVFVWRAFCLPSHKSPGLKTALGIQSVCVVVFLMALKVV